MSEIAQSDVQEIPIQARVALYQHILDEVKERRNERWKLAIYFTSVPIGVIALSRDQSFLSQHLALYKTSSVLLLAISLVLFFWLMVRNHQYLTSARNLRRRLESHFCFSNIRDSEGNSVFPQQWRNTRVSAQFELLDITGPLLVFTFTCQFLGIIYVLGLK